jgi:RNA polymerase sigma factor (sigma-70 family)
MMYAKTSPESSQDCTNNEHEGEYFFTPDFLDESAREMLLATLPASEKRRKSKAPNRCPAYLAHLWTVPLMTFEQEQHEFRKLNYLKFCAFNLESRLRSCIGCSAMVEELGMTRDHIVEIRNLVIESNLRLVVSLAKKYAHFGSNEFDEMICVGNAALMRAVDLFDYRRQVRFSTYAYRAIKTSIFSAYRKEAKMKSRFVESGAWAVDSVVGNAGESDIAELRSAEAREQVIQLMESLDERDRKIVMARFGINQQSKGVAFHVIAKEIGISTTRTVQLFHRSISKMRVLLSKRRSADTSESSICPACFT